METLLPFLFAAGLLYFTLRVYNRTDEEKAAVQKATVDALLSRIDLKDKEIALAEAIAKHNLDVRQRLEAQLNRREIEAKAHPFYLRDEQDELKIEREVRAKDEDERFFDEVAGLGK